MEKAPALTNELQFHLLRHFNRVDGDYLENFLKVSGYSREEVREQLEIQGSRFLYSFAPNPLILWNKISALIERDKCEILLHPGREVYSFRFDKNSYPEGIGLCYLVSLDDFSGEDKELLREEKRGEHTIKVIPGIPPVPTWEMHLVWITGPEEYIATVFPGTYAPPFPDREHQTESEYAKNSKFWEAYAIIKN